VDVLGVWRLRGPSGEDCEVRLAVRRLAALLVLRGRIQHRALVAGTLWPDSSDRRASANLRSTLWHARIECPGIVDGDAITVWLCEGVRSDFDEATDLVRSVLSGDQTPSGARVLLERDVLPDWPDEWLVPVRFVHRQLRLLALGLAERRLCDDTLATLQSSQGRTDR
jgi:DNA-binding SARP family transcriptional activator